MRFKKMIILDAIERGIAPSEGTGCGPQLVPPPGSLVDGLQKRVRKIKSAIIMRVRRSKRFQSRRTIAAEAVVAAYAARRPEVTLLCRGALR